jgi:hypothetical protein
LPIPRLGWHSSSTFDSDGVPKGGSCGATMRYEPEASYEDNRGLALARLVCDLVGGYVLMWVGMCSCGWVGARVGG